MSAFKFGIELVHDPYLTRMERLYIRVFGVPIMGMRIRARSILPLIDSLRGEKIFKIADAGSGRGLFSFYAARSFPHSQVVGMDIDYAQIERNNQICDKLGYKNCRFIYQDVTQIHEKCAYNLVLCTDNLEHIEDDFRQCSVFYRALSPGGRLLIHVPHITRNLFGWHRPNFMGIEGHVRPGYTKGHLSEMLNKAGFQIETAFYNYGHFETLVNDISYLITGGRERHKGFYSLAFPLLLGLSQLDRLMTPRNGSGLVILACKP